MGIPGVYAVAAAVVSTGDQVLFFLITIGAVAAGFIAVPLLIAGGAELAARSWKRLRRSPPPPPEPDRRRPPDDRYWTPD